MPPPNTAPTTRDVPLEACRFAADFATTPGASPAVGSPVPFRSLARTAQPVAHWYWGKRCLHDFNGMKAADRFPVDYCHEQEEVVGFCDAREATPEGLTCSGSLTPFTAGDRAAEIAFKAAQGVPYQASIYFDPFNMVVEEVPENMTAEVNGTTFAGPLTIFRQWTLLGLAVCPYGQDSGTDFGFSRQLTGRTAPVTTFTTATTQGEANMADAATTPETPPAAGEAAAPETCSACGQPTPTKQTASTETPPADKPKEPETKMSRKEEGARFVTAFGADHGPRLFAAGHTYDEAQGEYLKILQTENAELRANAAKFSQPAGGTTPATFSAAPGAAGDKPPETPTKFRNLSPALAKFAGGIKLPTNTTAKT